MWWESDTGRLKIYYNDGNSAQWVDASAGLLDDISTLWNKNNTGIHTLSNVGIGTTTSDSTLTVRGTLNVTGVSTFSSDVNVGVSTATGVILTSPNGSKFRLIVADNGALSTTSV